MKKRLAVNILLIGMLMLTACGGAEKSAVLQQGGNDNAENVLTENTVEVIGGNQTDESSKSVIQEEEAIDAKPDENSKTVELQGETVSAESDGREIQWNVAESVQEEESLGNPRSSYGLGSAPYLEGRNILVSMFVTTPESTWTEEEKQQMLKKVETAAVYIEEAARSYEIETELIYDFTEYPELYKEAVVDFLINEETDFLDRLDEEIALWFEESIDYTKMVDTFEADGIATMVFVNNPGISYAIVYDGTDNVKESLVLFSEDYYNGGKAELPITYAHEILHIFGAHDLYEEAEFTSEVTEYVETTYPREIMLTVTLSGNSETVIDADVSPITAYHLGWLNEIEEINLYPQLIRE